MNKLTISFLGIFVFLGLVLVGATVHAETTVNTDAQVDSINNLTKQIKALQEERKTKLSALITQLKQGTSGEAVTTLQTLLSLDESIYPEGLVTGYFGKLTAKAVKKFQEKHGLQQVGNVGPKTVALLRKFADDNSLTVDDDEEEAKDGDDDDEEDDDDDDEDGDNRGKGKWRRLCAMVPPGHLIAPGLLKKRGEGRPEIPLCQTLPKGIKDKIDEVDDDDDDDDNTDGSDKTAPVISDIKTSDITATSVKFTWKTSEDSKGRVWYGTARNACVSKLTVCPLSAVRPKEVIESNTYGTSHSVVLGSLTVDTTYYFFIGSEDKAGNMSVSDEKHFKTLVATDTTDPVISNLTTSDITTTGAKITWTTNEGAKDKVWYSTTNPVVTTGAANLDNNDLRTSHTFSLTGLTANTPYYYVVSSIDSAGNDAMSAQGTFTTAQ
ncbi:fibronectin type III domain-containing protein [Candidatus Nomurabacteria bacterium]|nr:fibronectin type III domain-containing protein [Candidatus Nomurabacteria bacterium]